MTNLVAFVVAAFCEIAGCFAFWTWARTGASVLWLLPGLVALASFAGLLTLAQTDAAGRAYAAYGGIYVVASLIWLRVIEGVEPDRWDLVGALLCLGGMAVILFGPRPA